MTITGKIKDGRIVLNKPYLIKKLEGKEVTITLEEKNVRSLDQNAFYHGPFLDSMIECIKERYGTETSKDDMQIWNKEHFFWKEVEEVKGSGVYTKKHSTTIFTPHEFELKLDEIRDKFAIAFEWKLPYPGDI